MKKILLSILISTALVFAANCGDKGGDNKEKQPENKEATNTQPKTDAAPNPELKKGEELYSQNCSSCHGDKGDGNGPAGAALNPKPRNFAAPAAEWKNGNTEEGILKTLNEGITGSPMIAYKQLGDESLKAITKYVVSLSQKK